MAIMETHIVSGQISTSVSGNSVNTSVSGNTVQLVAGTTVQLSPSGVFVMSGTVNTSVSGNVVNISGAQIQTSVSGNTVQTSVSGNTIILGQQSPPTLTWITQSLGTLIESQSGGISLPDVGDFHSGLLIAFIPPNATQYSGVQLPVIYYGGSGANAPYITPPSSGMSPQNKYIGTIGVQSWPGNIRTQDLNNIYPVTNTRGINILTSGGSGLMMFYGGWQ